MTFNARTVDAPTTSPAGFDYSQPIATELQAAARADDTLSAACTAAVPGKDLVATYAASGESEFRVEVRMPHAESAEQAWTEADRLRLPGSTRATRRYSIPTAATGVRFSVHCRQVANEVRIDAQAREA